MDPELMVWLALAIGVVAIALVFLLLMEHERKKPLSEEIMIPQRKETKEGLPFSVQRAITPDMFKEAKDKLRILDLEREILSYAVRRLYEANAEGKITEEERDKLALKYKEDLTRIKEEMARGESVLALNELERMQEEFVRLFSEHYEELNKKIEQLRTMSGFVPQKLEQLPQIEEPARSFETKEPEEPSEEESLEIKAAVEGKTEVKQLAEKEAPLMTIIKKKPIKPRTSPEPEKTEAEKRVEEIVAEVEKVLKKLGQMEVEE